MLRDVPKEHRDNAPRPFGRRTAPRRTSPRQKSAGAGPGQAAGHWAVERSTDLSTNLKTIPIWGLVSVTMTLGTLLSAILATVTLDAFLEGPGPASVTTRVPGFVYASATVMKVCIVTGMGLAVIGLVRRVSARRAEHTPGAPDPPKLGFPVWGITSITIAPLTPLVGAVTVLIAQGPSHTPGSLSMIDLSQFSRTVVIVMLFLLSAGAMTAATSL